MKCFKMKLSVELEKILLIYTYTTRNLYLLYNTFSLIALGHEFMNNSNKC